MAWNDSMLRNLASSSESPRKCHSSEISGELRNVGWLFASFDAQFLHPGFERSWLQSQYLSSAAFTADAPANNLHNAKYVVSLDVFKRLSVDKSSVCVHRRQVSPEHCARV